MLQNFLSYIGSGTLITIAVTLVALPMGMLVGLVFALVHIYGGKAPTRVMTVYSTLMRGILPIGRLFSLYFVIAGSINLSAFWAGSISLGIAGSAYLLEIFRGALLSVGAGQMMAARAIGMRRTEAICYVVLLLAFRYAIPPWSNEASIVLLKSTAIAFLIAAPDLMTKAKGIAARTYDPIGTYVAVAVVYLLVVGLLSEALKFLERRAKIPGLEVESSS